MSDARITINTDGMTESVHATRIENTNFYVVDNIPFFSRTIHLYDVVYCTPVDGSLPLVLAVDKASGWRTLHIHSGDMGRYEWRAHAIHEAIRQVGWSGEGGISGCWVAIPPESDVAIIRTWITKYPELKLGLY